MYLDDNSIFSLRLLFKFIGLFVRLGLYFFKSFKVLTNRKFDIQLSKLSNAAPFVIRFHVFAE
jgi:hypothetical protein